MYPSIAPAAVNRLGHGSVPNRTLSTIKPVLSLFYFTACLSAQTAFAQQSGGQPPQSGGAWFLVLLIIGIIVFIIARKGRVAAERRAREERRKPIDEFFRQLAVFDGPFPKDLFPRIPNSHFQYWLGQHPGPDLDDRRIDLWQLPLKTFPQKPTSEPERQAAEQAFWRHHLQYFVVENGGVPTLRPKHEIVNWWWERERLTFRFYYAATGTHHASVYSDRLIANLAMQERYRTEKAGAYDSPSFRMRIADLERAGKFLQDFWDKEVPAHRERWGEWFFVNIQKAFNAAYFPSDEDEIETQKAHGAARLATEAEATAAAVGSVRRSSVHDQEF